MVFGLTGSLASGKSAILKLLKQKGAVTFDADQRIHQYYRNKHSFVCKRVAHSFPTALKAGKICREKLGNIAFHDKAKLRKLEEIVHPVIVEDLFKWIKKAGDKKKIYIAEVPLLFEKKLASLFDGVILVVVKPELLIERIIKKYKFSKSAARSRPLFYMPVREKIKKSKFIIENSLSLKNLKKEVDLLWKKIK